MDSLTSRPIAEHLFTEGAEPRLIAGRNARTGGLVFPARPGDEQIPLARQGTLWSWTIQRFRPKSPPYIGPEAFEPFALGYVEFPGELIVEGRLTGIAFDAIRIGMAMTVTTIAFTADTDGRTVTTYAFIPAEETRA